ncbi:MAG TPA: tRNA (adenosine(37)-N6)-threonylcarbamoyltransferase complex ATPase subunit type 1 TsaE [Acidimicrobiales bacterium]
MSAGTAVWSVAARTAGAEETRALAARLAPLCRPGDVILLAGGLGAGKTTFAQGLARGLGVSGPVTSPTFTLVRHYRCAGPRVTTLLHADVYRLDTLGEVADLGLAELAEEDAVAVVEWGEAAAPVLGDSALVVSLTPEVPEAPEVSGTPVAPDAAAPGSHEVRLVTLAGRGPGWVARAAEVQAAVGELAAR